MKPFYFLLFSLGLGILIYVFIQIAAQGQLFVRPTLTAEIILINVFVTSLIYFWLVRTKQPIAFANSYLLSITLKLLFFSTVLFFIRLLSPDSLVGNATLLLVCYFLFTIQEVWILFVRVNR